MTTPREKAIEKARKVFALGVSTPFPGEKENCCKRLLDLMRAHRLVLHDLDRALPKRLDEALLRTRMGLKSGAKETAGKQEPQDSRKGPKEPRDPDPGSKRTRVSSDPEVVVFQHLRAVERRRVLSSAMFSRGIGQAIQGTSAYPRLLAEVHALNRSPDGEKLSDRELMDWLDRALKRQGSKVKVRATSSTIFEDLVAYCREEYQTDMTARRAAQARQAAEEKRRARAEAARKRREAQERKRQEQEAREKAQREEEERRRAAAEAEQEFEWEITFEVRAEAHLYRKIAQHELDAVAAWSGLTSQARVVKRGDEYVVKLTETEAFVEALDRKYAQVLRDLKQAAEGIKAEAARARDEAIAEAHAAYEEACEQALTVAVKHYRP